MSNTILEVKNLKTYFETESGLTVKAVDGISFNLNKGETLGIVGESGSGKSVTNLSLMGLIPQALGKNYGGQALFHGQDLLQMNEKELRSIRGNRISMIFQDPMTSLNPFLRISTQIIETLRAHQNITKQQAKDKAIELLASVGINHPEKCMHDYPHQFSGGMRQRVMIAMALACNPEILIADEPTSALDVTIQAQIIDLIQNLTQKTQTAVIMITHDLGVVADMCNKIVVMYAGHIVETGSADQIFREPKHPYTQGLLSSVPRLDHDPAQRLYSIPGNPPSLEETGACCPFWPRCPHGQKRKDCQTAYPPFRQFGKENSCVCWLYKEESSNEPQ